MQAVESDKTRKWVNQIDHVDDEDKLRTQIKHAGQNRELKILRSH